MFDYFANPTRFVRIADALFWPLVFLESGLLMAGLYYGLIASPADYQQEVAVRIMVHVPATWWQHGICGDGHLRAVLYRLAASAG